MFEKKIKYQMSLSISILELLAEKEYEEINSDLIVKNLKIKNNYSYVWMADDKIDLLKVYFEQSNDQILSEAFIDFQDDHSASINEKLTDIILRFCEFHEKYKSSIIKLHKLNFSDLKFIKLLVYCMHDLSKKSLKISGGETNSFRDSIILLGVISTYTLIFEKWISSRETDISYMMKIADKYINNAEEFASNLKII